MVDTHRAHARSRPRHDTAERSQRTFAPDRARFLPLRMVGRRLNLAIRRPVLACLLWRATGYRVRHRTDFREDRTSPRGDACER